MGSNLIIKHAGTIRRMAHTRDTFQTFVFRSMAACTFIILSAFSIWVFYRNSDDGCKGTLFTVQGHYSNALWMESVFNSFRDSIANGEIDINPDNICLELVIGEDRLRRKSKPAVWNPHHTYWLDLASYDFAISDSFVNYSCINTTAIPMGIVAWNRTAALLFGDNVNVVGLRQLNEQFVSSYLNDSNEEREVLLNIFGGLSLAHGHPNVTTGGLLFMIDAIDSLDGSVTNQQDIYLLSGLENQVTGYAPTDTDHLSDMMMYGPQYLKAAVSFENLVIRINREFGDEIYEQWGDVLKFIYLNETYWVSHPLCTMIGSKWMSEKDDAKKVALSEKFKDYVKSITDDDSLMGFGLRPVSAKYNSSVLNRTIWNEENGVDPDITADDAIDIEAHLPYPSIDDLINVQAGFAQVQKPAYLHILIDVSAKMLETTTSSESRWNFLRKSLDDFYTNMTDRAIIHVSCLASESVGSYYMVACDNYNVNGFEDTTVDYTTLDEVNPGQFRQLHGFYPLKNLTTQRETLAALFEAIGPQRAQKDLLPMSSLQIMYQLTQRYKDYQYTAYQECVESYENSDATVETLTGLFQNCILYNYRMLLISQRARKEPRIERSYYNEFLEDLDRPVHANMTQIYNVLYWDSNDVMQARMENISNLTGARDFSAGTDVGDIIERLLYYF